MIISLEKYREEAISSFNLEYIEAAFSTANMNHKYYTRIINWCYGLEGEFGEIIDCFKKYLFHEHPMNEKLEEKVKKEIGDLCWYLAVITKEHDLNLFSNVSENYVSHINDYFANIDMTLRAIKTFKDNVFDAFCYNNIKNYNIESITNNIECLIYLVINLCKILNLSFHDILSDNTKKLKERYKNGFTVKESIERKENA